MHGSQEDRAVAKRMEKKRREAKASLDSLRRDINDALKPITLYWAKVYGYKMPQAK